ncbi:MAG: kinase [Actinobacteria bacterium]|nr:MAG: kinase [Actinomycetota bacterium]
MIISRTPFRVSFFGGGTDYPEWYREHGGAVLATTIDKYCYLTCRYLPPFFEHKIRIIYSKIENCMTVDDIRHPSAREVIRYLAIDRGLEIHHDADLPARSGLGSSSAFTVGLLHALYALQGRMVGKNELTREAIHIEQDVLRETVGSQDQASTAHGGFSGELVVTPVAATSGRIHELNDNCLLFYTGIKRTAETVARSYVDDINSKKRQLRLMKDLTDEAVTIFSTGVDLKAFGYLLHEAWEAKRSLSAQVSNSDVDDIYRIARSNGASGGKLLGAGGGGFFLVFAAPDRHHAIRQALSKLVFVPFRFEFSGSQVIFMDREQDYLEVESQAVPARRFRELDAAGDPAAD